jgi:alpha-glucosidase (family GH31 glycosyl hydrolase)
VRLATARTLAAALALVALLATPAPAAETVPAGAIEARVDLDPWHVEFVQPDGPTLSEARHTGTGPAGTLGFRTSTGWWHATRALTTGHDGQALTAELATTDPLGRRLAVRVEPSGEGAIGLTAAVTGAAGTGDVEAVGVGFDAAERERYLGFGERSNAVDQRGNEVESYVAEGPYQPEERAFLTAFVPPWGYHPRDDATYFPMPWLLSTRGYGVLIDNNEASLHRLGSERFDAWSMETQASQIAFRVLAGPTPAATVRRLTERTGRQPKPLAPWFLGPWFHTGQENVPPPGREEEAVRTLREADAPASAVETHLRYLPCGEAVPHRAAERERTAFFHRNGLATLSYVNSEICQEYEPVWSDGAARGVFQRDSSGKPYVFNAYVGSRTPPQTPVSQVDFTAPGAQEFWNGLMSQLVEDGHDGFMEDFGEYTPLDSQHANGMSGPQMHNFYPVPYHRAGWEFARRQERPIARHVRSGWTGVHPYAQIVWGGDPTTDWGYDGLASAVTNALTMGLSGISTWGSDIGGYFSLGTRQLTPELMIRWIQFGAVSGVMRTKYAGVAIPPKGERPQPWSKEVLGHWRRYAKLRTQLYPYIAAHEAGYRRTGLPLMRHLALTDPADARAAATDDQFLFGPDLLAAPVLEPGATQRGLYVPNGRWFDLWRTVAYHEPTGGLRLGRPARVRPGDRTVDAPLDQLPLLLRAGAVLPLLPPDVDTLADYGGGSGVVRLRDRRRRTDLIAVPRGRTESRMYERERLVSIEGARSWRLKVAGRARRTYGLQASMLTLRRPFRPCSVRLGGRPLSRRAWSYRASTGVLRATFTAKSASLSVGRCG